VRFQANTSNVGHAESPWLEIQSGSSIPFGTSIAAFINACLRNPSLGGHFSKVPRLRPTETNLDEMTDQQISNKVNTLEKTVEKADDRTLRLGEKLETLKDYVQTDLALKVATSEGRGGTILWILGIALPAYLGLFIAGGVQLYLLNGRAATLESNVLNIGKGVDALLPQEINNMAVTKAKETNRFAKNALRMLLQSWRCVKAKCVCSLVGPRRDRLETRLNASCG